MLIELLLPQTTAAFRALTDQQLFCITVDLLAEMIIGPKENTELLLRLAEREMSHRSAS